ncbi:MAG: Asp23/Gls24 family envelope stress response protein [Bacillota bacterium]|nr:Asp23/Gls24 family envelope stress response protein [Bacillota bacterium]
MVNEESPTVSTELGMVRIADEVVSIIAGLAASEIKGVSSMSGGIGGGIAEVLGRRNLSKGVKVDVGAEDAKIDIFIIVEYGERIPDVSWNIQESVKKAVETMTGLKVTYVNVHVQGVQFPETEEEAAANEEAEAAANEAAAQNEEKAAEKEKK